MQESALASISFDGVHLLLPQQRVATIERVTELDTRAAGAGSVGQLRIGPLQWPAWVLGADFRRRGEIPTGYSFCVAINSEADRPAFALVCQQVGNVTIADAEDLEPLQPCMQTADNPVDALVFQDDRLMLVSDVDAIAEFLATRVAA